MSQDLLPKIDQGDFQTVFIDDLNWHAPDVKQAVTATDEAGHKVSARNIASYKGLRVWLCDERPGSVLEAALDRLIAKTSTDRLVIFDDDTEQVWRWPVRRAKDGAVTSRLTSHRHKKGEPDPKFAARLDIIRMPFDVVLDANAVLGKVREAFDTEAQNESKRASKLMAAMYAAVEKAYPAKVDAKVRDHEISVTLARILFLMFGDDTEMWQTDAFRNVIQHDVLPDGSNLAQILNQLFTFLDTANPTQVPTGFAGFKYVNGGIFEEKIDLPPLSKDFRTAILDACAVDWAGISPAIFGSMFQSVRDAATRRALGEHYTSEENILKTLNPLFLDELRDELSAALARDTPQKQTNSLKKLWERLGDIRFMDPACGCGNFIIIAYRELRAIELQVMEELQKRRQGAGQATLGEGLVRQIRVTLDHFYGIEIDEWPARIAETAMFMIDRQCDLKLEERFGHAPERLPIQREAKIVVADALDLDWGSVCSASANVCVAGNPPFLGHISRTTRQTEQLRAAWGGGDIGRLDFVTAWYAKAMLYYGPIKGCWGFVSTNSVTQGDQVPRLFGPVFAEGWRLRFAHRTFAWASEAAGKATVHCNILGFDRGQGPATLFEYSSPTSEATSVVVTRINGYLADGPNVLVSPRTIPLSPELSPVTFGNMPRDGGGLVVEIEDLDLVRRDSIAAKYLRPFIGSEELVRGTSRWCLWLMDATESDLTRSPVLRERLERVRDFRLESRATSTRGMAATPHLFGQRAAEMTVPYLAIPAVVSESRPFYTAARLGPDSIASNKLYVAGDGDGFMFAVISSSMFLTWQFTVGNRLESRPSFSNTLVWNNLPLPRLVDSARQEIANAGIAVATARERHGIPLSKLYEPGKMPGDLEAAHADLDTLVDGAFGLHGRRVAPDDRRSALFAMYAQMTR